MLKLYYKSVNRGLSFTKPGLYTIGYVMAIGLLAIITGINGFYIFMSTGLALLIVSGMISERVMRYNRVTHLESISSEANAPFNLSFSVKNSSKIFTTYGIETSFDLQKPNPKILAKQEPAPIAGRALKIDPGRTSTFNARCEGLPRGCHRTIFVTQRTRYPFGFLEKFKIIELPCSLVVTPATDHKLLAELSLEVARRRSQADADREFYSHNAYSHKEPPKHIDWKRSAGKPPADWVVKQYRSEAQNFHYRVLGLWRHADSALNAANYELFLARLLTAIKVLASDQSFVGLDIGTGAIEWGSDAAKLALAGAPQFEKRLGRLQFSQTGVTPSGKCLTLEITPNTHFWQVEAGKEAG